MISSTEELFNAKELHLMCSFTIGSRGAVHEHHRVWHITNIRRWKRDPARFDVTIKHGLKGWEHITSLSDLGSNVYTETTCPAFIASKEYNDSINRDA